MESNVISIASPLTRGTSFTVQQLADGYMAQYSGRDGSMAARLHYWVKRIGHRVASEITEDDILDGLDALRERGALKNIAGRGNASNVVPVYAPIKPSTLNRYRMALQSVYVWGIRKRLFPKGFAHPFSGIQQEREDNGRIRFLTPDEYKRLLAAARLSYWPKMLALVMLAVTTGARKGALLGLRWQDLDLDAGRAIVERTKNGQPQVYVLLPEVMDELRKFKRGGQEDLVFAGRSPLKPHNFTHSWAVALKDAKLDDGSVCFHVLRHTHASWLAQGGATLLEIADSMGHKSLVMTQRYAHLCTNHKADLVSRVFGQAA